MVPIWYLCGTYGYSTQKKSRKLNIHIPWIRPSVQYTVRYCTTGVRVYEYEYVAPPSRGHKSGLRSLVGPQEPGTIKWCVRPGTRRSLGPKMTVFGVGMPIFTSMPHHHVLLAAPARLSIIRASGSKICHQLPVWVCARQSGMPPPQDACPM